MKKILLIPTLLATSVTSLSCLSSLTSCGKHNYSKDYLTFEALEDGQLSCDINVLHGEPEINLNVQYSLNNSKWTTLEVNKDNEYTNYLSYKIGDKIRLKGINDYWSRDVSVTYFSSLHFTGLVNVSGNIMSLLYGDDFVDQTTIPCEACFESLFDSTNYFGKNGEHLEFVQIHDAQNLILPATTLTDLCYAVMFSDCDSLATVPALPATTLADWCYSGMFEDCDSLVNAPELSAKTLTESCYNSMFYNCKSLKKAPALPATTLADWCYSGMFEDCDSLVNAPALPATTLADSCYYEMFLDCDSLVTAPALPATTLLFKCYARMFEGCKALHTAPKLPAEKLADECYRFMFKNCTSLIVNTEGDSDHLIFNCPETQGLDCPIEQMFAGTKGTHDDTPVASTSYYWAEE